MMYVHYHKDTGRIGAWGDGPSDNSHLVDHEILLLSENVMIDPKKHKVAGGKVVDMEGDELLPSLDEMATRVRAELVATDQYMMPDRKVPNRDDWIDYRRILRDLSKLKSVAAQLAAWPVRPDKG